MPEPSIGEFSKEPPRFWARYWSVEGGCVVHLYLDDGPRTRYGDGATPQEVVIGELNRLPGVRNLAQVPEGVHRSRVAGTEQLLVVSHLEPSELLGSVGARLTELLGEEHVVLAEG